MNGYVGSQHLVRVGAMGHVGRFGAVEASIFARGARVICRTPRGLEVGEVLQGPHDLSRGDLDGSLLRAVTSEDELLLLRLDQNRHEAFAACNELLARRGCSAILLDVETLFDGQSIYFYFLGDVTEDVQALTTELAAAYDSKVQFRRFTDAAIAGCGPDCGTEDASGCSTGGCTSCAIADACKHP
ncbi:MAG: PSP1 C-terminal domain-containing protein [Pirellulaceae bacterium]|nr:hypothetical protein [Planctomycetales bacterium]